ncbi:hypothetical protein EAH87_13780 [Sphingomonas koreensis]|nr:hypothetical protein EAH87_13780 [Sphingomonas koreensis]
MIAELRRARTIAVLAITASCHPAGSDGNGSAAAPAAASASALPSAVAPSATAASPPVRESLSGYIGRYPFDAVNGVTFLANPAVTHVVDALAPGPAVRALVLAGDGPGAPIAAIGGELAAWGCETHNCGDHNWTILIAPDGGQGQLCYHDAAAMHDRSRWYVAADKAEMRDGGCPSA